ncbi:MAG: DUF21 domain-containing protein [Chitinivibrionales bacterium]|nr:DUF21 domain-containing protein [Chitinivibrionales bacterium]
MALMIIYLISAIIISFICSVLEAVLLSVSPAYIKVLEQKNPSAGNKLLAFKTDIDKPLSAILSLNTIAHTIGAAGVGAQAQIVFGKASVGLISAILTFLILVFSEIIPKTIGASYWRLLVIPSTQTMRIVVFLMYPLTLLSRFLTKLIGRKGNTGALTREELNAQVDLSLKEGILRGQESRVFKNLIRFRSLQAKDIMTPRPVLISYPQTETVGSVADKNLPVSRILVHRENAPEDITGYVLKSELLDWVARDKPQKQLCDFKREILTVPESLNVEELLEKLLKGHEHITVLIDEYGGLAGIVTMEDIIETLLGMEIVDEMDTVEDMQAYARDRWRERAERLGLLRNENELK